MVFSQFSPPTATFQTPPLTLLSSSSTQLRSFILHHPYQPRSAKKKKKKKKNVANIAEKPITFFYNSIPLSSIIRINPDWQNRGKKKKKKKNRSHLGKTHHCKTSLFVSPFVAWCFSTSPPIWSTVNTHSSTPISTMPDSKLHTVTLNHPSPPPLKPSTTSNPWAPLHQTHLPPHQTLDSRENREEKKWKGKRRTREGEGLNEWTEKEENEKKKKKKLKRGDESVTGEREREELIKWKPNKILVLFLQLCYNAILQVELHCSTIANFFAILAFYKPSYGGFWGPLCWTHLTFGISMPNCGCSKNGL